MGRHQAVPAKQAARRAACVLKASFGFCVRVRHGRDLPDSVHAQLAHVGERHRRATS